jgi:regulator of protease activity HflC (stomatin/prohibitin superfamily)
MDNITMTIDASVYYYVLNPRRACYTVENVTHAVRYLTIATLRNICG